MTILVQNGADSSRLYYGTDTRMAGLLIGAAAAFLWLPGRLPALERALVRALMNLVGLAAVAALVGLHVFLDDGASFLYRGGFLLTGLLTAITIVLVVHPRLRLRHLLGWQPLRWFGVRSYSIYLWHWPVFMVTQPRVDVPLDGIALFGLRLAITVGLAALSYQLVERPVRNGALGRLIDGLRAGPRARPLRYGFALTALGATSAGIVALVVLSGLARSPALPAYGNVESLRIVSRTVDESASTLSTIAVDTSSPAWSRDRLLEAGRAPFVPGSPPLGEAAPDAQALSATTDWWFDSSLISSTVSSPAEPAAEVAGLQAASAPRPPLAPGPLPGIRVSAVGDSVMLGAASSLLRVFPDLDVDAEVGRQSATLIDVIQQRLDAGTLGDVVVVQVGNNGTVSSAQMDEILHLLQDVRRVVVVNVRLPRTWEESNNTIIAATVANYDNAVLANWYEASKDNPDYFVRDRVHLRAAGAAAFAETILEAIQQP
jgi:hypothetical protein